MLLLKKDTGISGWHMPSKWFANKKVESANKMRESVFAERLYWCSRNAILFANCSQNKEEGATF